MTTPTILEALLLFATGAVASGINAVAGGGSLVSFPVLTVAMHIPERIANATNSVGLFPGSLAGGLGYRNLLSKTAHHLKHLAVPTVLGSITGALLLMNTSDVTFERVIPILILMAAVLLILQPQVKKLIGHERTLPTWVVIVLQYLVSTYGGYFGAGMGIMMLACFALYMDGNTHELNAVKNWLGLLINFTCSVVFLTKGLVLPVPGLLLVAGSLVGGFISARVSQRFNPDRMRLVIAIYGVGMAVYFAYKAYF